VKARPTPDPSFTRTAQRRPDRVAERFE